MTPAPLTGVRVLDLTRYIPGPYCTMLLADLGADVVKVEEPPFGDPTRLVPPAVGADTAAHRALNRNKRSITVDLRNEAGAAVVRRLAGRADVLVEAFRPGVLARRGLGAESLLAEHPRLVYCSITGYGQGGPQAGRAGHDVDYAALGGLLAVIRDAEGRPVLPGAQLADMTGALLAALGILSALLARERTGRGQLVDVSLLEGVLALMTVPAARRTAGGPSMAVNELAGSHACYNLYRCRDGRHLAVGALEPKFWESLCRALGRPELVARQWEPGPAAGDTIRVLAETFAAKDRDDWIRELSAVDACVEPILEPDEALTQPQVNARRAVVEGDPGGGALRLPATPLRLGATPCSSSRPAPRLGEHTDAVLVEVGYGAEEIARLRAQGALG
jgi:crotonobetainyl-CoA:carnitine CoA-transferase CaiB-like acyl-CoA transferase